MPLMADRTRITFDVSDRLHRALNIYASRKKLSVGQVMEWMAEQLIPADLALADQSIAEGDPPPKGKRGRKPAAD